MENVLPHESIQEHFDDITDQWGAHPIVLDSADGHMVSRPRLWWNTIHWEQAQETISTQTLATDMGETSTIRQTSQSNSSRPTAQYPRKRVGNTQHPRTGRSIPLPHHPGQHRRREASSPTHRCGPGHLGTLGTRQETVPTMAVPTTVPHQRTPG